MHTWLMMCGRALLDFMLREISWNVSEVVVKVWCEGVNYFAVWISLRCQLLWLVNCTWLIGTYMNSGGLQTKPCCSSPVKLNDHTVA